MGYREFKDAEGEFWKVWDVTPDQRIFLKRRTPSRGTPQRAERTIEEDLLASEVTPSRERGWLAFQSRDQNRRLSPIPPNWEAASEVEMRNYLANASQVKNRYKA